MIKNKLKGLTISLFAILFVTLMIAIVMAENDSNTGNNSYTNNSNKMTFGKCVSEAAQIRQGCYGLEKNISKQCVNIANLTKDENKERQCFSDYKESKKNCRSIFKEAKINCIQIYKPNFWERMQYVFK
jgi:hypothetical protein